jgi:hypothetical protein
VSPTEGCKFVDAFGQHERDAFKPPVAAAILVAPPAQMGCGLTPASGGNARIGFVTKFPCSLQKKSEIRNKVSSDDYGALPLDVPGHTNALSVKCAKWVSIVSAPRCLINRGLRLSEV